uniref:Uncharacterized protein n=1 Tax=Anopheles atroparvus TaxID=41427 RepID=A0A182JLE0_ANOAO
MTNLCVYVGLLLSLLVATGRAHLNLYLNEIEVQRLLGSPSSISATFCEVHTGLLCRLHSRFSNELKLQRAGASGQQSSFILVGTTVGTTTNDTEAICTHLLLRFGLPFLRQTHTTLVRQNKGNNGPQFVNPKFELTRLRTRRPLSGDSTNRYLSKEPGKRILTGRVIAQSHSFEPYPSGD